MAVKFADDEDLLAFARDFLNERTRSLCNDADVCMGRVPVALFPLLLYCFATIDLLGALLGGDSTSKTGMSSRATCYMRRFMGYSEDHCKYLTGVFRHKMVHLAQPDALLVEGAVRTTWACATNDKSLHLVIAKLPDFMFLNLPRGITFHPTQSFSVSVTHLVNDIVNSVAGPNGYYASLQESPELRGLFLKAIEGIYDG